MSWVNGADNDDFVIHEKPAPKREKVLGQLRYEIVAASWQLAQGRRAGICSEEGLRERRTFVARAQAVREAIEKGKIDENVNIAICEPQP